MTKTKTTSDKVLHFIGRSWITTDELAKKTGFIKKSLGGSLANLTNKGIIEKFFFKKSRGNSLYRRKYAKN